MRAWVAMVFVCLVAALGCGLACQPKESPQVDEAKKDPVKPLQGEGGGEEQGAQEGARGTAGASGEGGAEGEVQTGAPFAAVNQCDKKSATALTGEHLQEDLTVPAKACVLVSSWMSPQGVLRIEAGATFLFESGAGLFVGDAAALAVQGRADELVTFKGVVDSAGYWGGIVVSSNHPLNHLQHAVIDGGGSTTYLSSYPANLAAEGSAQIKIEHVQMRRSGGYGLVLGGEVKLGAFTQNRFADNKMAPVLVGAEQVRHLDAASDFLGGGAADAVFVEVSGGRVTENGHWHALNAPYAIKEGIDVKARLSIGPGVRCHFHPDTHLDVNERGALEIKGSAEQPVSLDGLPGEASLWRGVFVRTNNPVNVLEHCRIARGGQSEYYSDVAAGLFVADEAQITLRHVQIEGSGGYGLALSPAVKVNGFSHNVFHTNKLGPVYLAADQVRFLDSESHYVVPGDAEEFLLPVFVSGGDVENKAVWANLDVPVRFAYPVTVRNGLTVQAGAVLNFDESAALIVEKGYLKIDGREDERVVLQATDPTVAKWYGVNIGTQNPENVLKHVDILDAGRDAYYTEHAAALWVSGSVALEAVRIERSGGWGLFLQDLASVTPADAIGEGGLSGADNALGDMGRTL